MIPILLLSTLAFPVSGTIALLVTGPAKSIKATLIGGALVGTILGFIYGYILKGYIDMPIILGSAVALALSNTIAMSFNKYTTSFKSLLQLGLISGIALGLTQGLLLGNAYWGIAIAIGWIVGWPLMKKIGIDVDKQYHIFGLIPALLLNILLVVFIMLKLV
jgi:hypothetical protein